MPRYVKKYINSITESNILKVYTSEDNSQIKVFFKIANEEIDRIFSGQEVVKFLNQTTNIRDHENKSAISKNVEQGIIRDVEGIHRENGRYVYKSDLLAEEQYRELFDSRQAIKFNLNDFMSDSISKIVHLRSRFEGILGFDPEEGLCQPLIYFITLLGLKSREDFAKLLKSGDVVSEQDFIAYVDGRKEQTTGLLATQILLQFLPILHIQSIERREGDQFYDKTIYEQECNDLSSTEVWIHINQEKVKCALDNVEIECCLEFNFSCYTCNEGDSDDDDENIAHSMLVYKAENGKYIFFDPNRGAVGFCPNTGVANFTSEEVCRAVELAVNFYSYNMYIENSPDYCEIYVTLRNATLMLRKAEELYETRERTNSKIVDISVDNNTGKLLLTPINL